MSRNKQGREAKKPKQPKPSKKPSDMQISQVNKESGRS
jgi:hypothetical protein